MDSNILTDLGPLLGVLLGGAISLITTWQSGKHQLASTREQVKTEYMAEKTAHYLLSHAGYTNQSFETLKQHLGGFEDDELRKILVRAGGIRAIRKDGEEWWRLVDRMDEYIEKKMNKD